MPATERWIPTVAHGKCRAAGQSGCGTGDDEGQEHPRGPGGRENPGPHPPTGESGCSKESGLDQLPKQSRSSAIQVESVSDTIGDHDQFTQTRYFLQRALLAHDCHFECEKSRFPHRIGRSRFLASLGKTTLRLSLINLLGDLQSRNFLGLLDRLIKNFP